MKRVGYMVVAILILLGVYTLYSGVRTAYTDYQDFKAIRGWVRAKAQQEQRQQRPYVQPPTPGPAQ